MSEKGDGFITRNTRNTARGNWAGPGRGRGTRKVLRESQGAKCLDDAIRHAQGGGGGTSSTEDTDGYSAEVSMKRC